jgi:hypothetical protein
MFGKPIAAYLGFQKVFLAAIALVGVARLALSLAGISNSAARWFSMNVVVLIGVIWYGIAVHKRRFGSYKQLLPLVLFQLTLMQAIAVTGILLTIAGFPNIFSAPEYSGPVPPSSQWIHALAHLTIGMVVPTLLGWGVASLTLLITRKVSRQPAAA